MAKGPIGNSPRDLRDSYVGEDILYKGGEPPKHARGPKKVSSNTFHSKVTGPTSNKRPDRPGHFRSGGFVRGKADGGSVNMPDRPPPRPSEESSVGPMRPTGSGTYDPSTGRVKGFKSGGKTGADAGDMKAGFPKGPPTKKLLQDADGMKKGGKV